MSDLTSPSTSDGILPIEDLLDAFDEAWQSGEPEDIFFYADTFLPVVPDPAKFRFLTELVLIDMEYRWLRYNPGGDPYPRYTIADYLSGIPYLASRPETSPLLVVEEYRFRKKIGETPSPEDYRSFVDITGESIQQSFQKIDQEFDSHSNETVRAIPHKNVAAHQKSPLPELPSETEFGDYLIVKEIARGGMGVVYLAYQKSLGRTVALKLILPSVRTSPSELRRFQREARAAAALDHPGIVPIYEVGHRDGIEFFSMRYIDGPSLADLVKRAPLSPTTAAAVMRQVGMAVEYAHQQGIVHRDLKPANILMSSDGPVITDFGIAKPIHSDSGLTLPSQIVGTPAYMPPEQAKGLTHEVGIASDVYSLGATLYCLLTGRPPFQSASVLETLAHVVGHDPVPVRRLNSEVSQDLETVCLKCLNKDPRQRYQSAQSFVEDLERFLAGHPVQAKPVSMFGRTIKWCRRNPAVAALSLGVIVLTASIILVSIIGLVHTSSALARARMQERETSRALQLAEAAREFADKQRQEAVIAQQASEEARQAALEFRERERLARLEVEQSFQRAEASLYLAEIGRAERMWRLNQPDEAVHLLRGLPRRLKYWNHLKGWEWQYLLNQWQTAMTFSHDNGSVLSIAVSESGSKLATIAGSEIKLWSIPDGQHLQTLQEPADWIRKVAFYGEDQLITVSSLGHLAIWSLKTGKRKLCYSSGTRLSGTDTLADGKKVALVTSNGELTVVDLPEGQVALSLNVSRSSPTAVALAPNGEQIAIGDSEGGITLIHNEQGENHKRLEGHRAAIFSLVFMPHQNRLASAGQDGVVRIWETESGQLVRTLEYHQKSVYALAYSAKRNRLYSGGADSTICEWFMEKPTRPEIFRGHVGQVLALQVADHPQLGLISGSDSGLARGWALRTLTVQLPGSHVPIASVSTEFRGKSGLLALQENGALYFAMPGALPVVEKVHTFPAPPQCAAFSDDGSRLLTISATEEIQLFGENWDQPIRTLQFDGEGAKFRDPVIGRNGSLLAVRSGRMIVAEYSNGERSIQRNWKLPAEQGEILAYQHRMSPWRLIVLTTQGQFLEWNLETDSTRGLASQRHCHTLLVHPQLETFATSTLDGRISILDPAGNELVQFQNGSSKTTVMSFHPAGNRIAIGELDGTIRIWDVAHGQEVLTLTGHQNTIFRLHWAPDGHLYSIDTGGEIRAW